MKKNGFYKFRLMPLCLSFFIMFATALWSANPIVYVVGYENEGAKRNEYDTVERGKAIAWVDGVKKSLSGLPDTVYSFSIYNGKIYAAGETSNNTPCYSIDGVKKEIKLEDENPELVVSGSVYDIVVYDGQVYASGETGYYQRPGSGIENVSALWLGVEIAKNGFMGDYYSNEGGGTYVMQFTIYKGKPYMTLFSEGIALEKGANYLGATYVANGKEFKLTGTEAVTSDIKVYNGKVYVSGRYKKGGYNRACFWVDGKRVDLPGGKASRATSIHVAKGKVYVSGYYYDKANKACYWENGVLKELAGGTLPGAVDDDALLPIAVHNDKVYIAGYYYEGKTKKACYWIDGKKVNLSGGVKAVAIEVQ